jgi:tetratricopeptide (TPR) repeat protein
VVLYELLTGTTPIDRESMRQAALDEMLRMIREVEPATPSSRLSTSETTPSVAASRQVEPARLSRLVRGDLDWIAMKALAKERERRYATAAALADDLEHYLHHEPVSAGPPTAAYRLRKFVRRNRVQVAAAGLVLLALAAGVVGTTLGLVEARRQERIADEQRRQAEKRLSQVTKMNEILGSIFEDLNPKKAAKDRKPLSAILGERLDQATEKIEGEATGDPLTVAKMQMTLGMSQLNLGYPERAIALFTKARATFAAELGPDHPEALRSMNELGVAYDNAGKLDLAIPLQEETLRLHKARLGPDHPDTLKCMNNLAVSYNYAGQRSRALRLHEEALALTKAKLGPDHPDTLASMSNLGATYNGAGKPDLAIPLQEETLRLHKAKLGPDHRGTLATMNSLAASYAHVGRYDRALELFEEALALRRSKLGPDHPDTLQALGDQADCLANSGQIDRAAEILEEVIALRRKTQGEGHPDTLRSRMNLAILDLARGRLDTAEAAGRAILDDCRAKLGADDRVTIAAGLALARVLEARGDRGAAAPLYRAALESARKKPSDREALAAALTESGRSRLAGGDWTRAEALLREALAVREAEKPQHWQTAEAKSLLGGAPLGLSKPAKAEPLLRSGYEGMARSAPAIPLVDRPRLAEALDRLIAFGETAGTKDELARWKAERAKLASAGPKQ